MKHVLYTRDFEPITIIELPMEAFERVRAGDRWRLLVREPFEPRVLLPSDSFAEIALKIVTIEARKLNWYGELKWVLVTTDEVNALRLPLQALPGQEHQLQQQRKTIEALTDALIRAMRGE